MKKCKNCENLVPEDFVNQQDYCSKCRSESNPMVEVRHISTEDHFYICAIDQDKVGKAGAYIPVFLKRYNCGAEKPGPWNKFRGEFLAIPGLPSQWPRQLPK